MEVGGVLCLNGLRERSVYVCAASNRSAKRGRSEVGCGGGCALVHSDGTSQPPHLRGRPSNENQQQRKWFARMAQNAPPFPRTPPYWVLVGATTPNLNWSFYFDLSLAEGEGAALTPTCCCCCCCCCCCVCVCVRAHVPLAGLLQAQAAGSVQQFDKAKKLYNQVRPGGGPR